MTPRTTVALELTGTAPRPSTAESRERPAIYLRCVDTVDPLLLGHVACAASSHEIA